MDVSWDKVAKETGKDINGNTIFMVDHKALQGYYTDLQESGAVKFLTADDLGLLSDAKNYANAIFGITDEESS